ncbi:MAG: bifunctional adenosylcobinamide kinase/adenosylcobinamide-phosphate guanylyltransferase [Rhizobiales bacterium]|nr:bifunctional adenosylcobinamide kinase/adenosylcobinamide-phosphate guanylyltransferase [Hyphomicrobiales bacterium]
MTFPLLVLGGARSGKSALALARAQASGLARVMIATATAGDAEMAARIARHRAERDATWRTVEAPLDLVGALADAAAPERVVVVECLTLWLSNVMLAGRDADAETAALVAAAGALAGPVVFVSNEVGLGLVPETPLGRAFRDAQGRLNQAMARVAAQVVFVAAGLPLTLKG